MTDLFQNHGLLYNGILSLSPREAKGLTERGLIIVDLRHIDYLTYKAFDVEHLIHLPAAQFDEGISALDPEKYYVLADASGIHSRAYAEKLHGLGYKHVASLSGGFVEWERDGMPVRENVRERLTGACACQLRPREK